MTREGPFWDVMEGRAAPPPAATLLGWELVEVDPEAGTIEVAFTASEQFLNPVGAIQGGFLAAMLDDTLGPALVATLGPGLFAPTTDLHVQFLRGSPVAAGSSASAGRWRSWPGNCSMTPARSSRPPWPRPRSAPCCPGPGRRGLGRLAAYQPPRCTTSPNGRRSGSRIGVSGRPEG
jgi:hypothetical protein